MADTCAGPGEAILQREVVFFRALDPEDQKRFRRELQVFLGEKRITGIKLELDTTTRVLTAASAIIPIFGFPEWEWDQISEVLVYPDRFDREFAFGGDGARRTLGMVGSGALNRLMILSRQHGRLDEGTGRLRIQHGLSQQGLADSANLSRVSVNRQLAEWQGRGLAASGRGFVEIPDPAALEAHVWRTPRPGTLDRPLGDPAVLAGPSKSADRSA